jgi:chromosomal replication initiator protein
VDILVDTSAIDGAEAQVNDPDNLWTAWEALLQAKVGDATWRTWCSGLVPVELGSSTWILGAPSGIIRDRLEQRLLPLFEHAASELLDRPVRVVLSVQRIEPTVQQLLDPAAPEQEADPERDPGAAGRAPASEPTVLAPEPLFLPVDPPVESPPNSTSHGARRAGGRSGEVSGLDPRYTFDAFVIGSSNRFAHAAALSVAEKPAGSYNPLFIHGGAGLGKTHLLHAIGNYVAENFAGRHVRYVSTETFMNEFVEAIRTTGTSAFKRRYRECDVLLIDDVQFMEGKEALQEEFFHTFNHLYGASKQIVLTSDRPPKSIATLESRLRSRFLSGLITDVQPPDLETRLAILQKKAERERVHIPMDVLEFIATNVTDNIRELEGALIRVTAYGSLNGQPITRELAEHVLSDLVSSRQPRRVTPQLILAATAESFGFSVEELTGPSRRRPLVTARQISMYVFRELTDLSYPAIAREFGGRDHSTVIHAVERITDMMKEQRAIYEQVTDLILRIKSAL